MFERYTERARRVIFFSRYKASQFQSPQIESDHLLLGLMQEDKALLSGFLTYEQLNDISLAIESARGPVKTARSEDLPLSLGSRLALKSAADQADQRSDRHIATEHLLLGLLSQQSSLAAQLLIQHGVTTESVLHSLKKAPSGERPRSEFRKQGLNPPPPWSWPDAT